MIERNRHIVKIKKYGELFLCLDEFDEFVELIERDTMFNATPIYNNVEEIVGCSWDHLGNKVTIVKPEELEEEYLLFEGCDDIGDRINMEWNSEELATKLFVPWELHLPVYIIAEMNEDSSVSNDASSNAWLSSFIRIMLEEFAETIGGWTPADKKLTFDKSTWDFDVFMYSFREPHEVDMEMVKNLIEVRTMGSSDYKNYL